MVLNIFKCGNAECARVIEAQQECTAGMSTLLCKVCGAGMVMLRNFYRCDTCKKEADPKEGEGWCRFSFGAHYYAGNKNWTTGHCQTAEFCSFACEGEWLARILPTLPDISRENIRSMEYKEPAI